MPASDQPAVQRSPHDFDGVVAISDVHSAHEGLEAGEETDSAYRIAGRLGGRRGHGGAAFLDVIDRSGKLQVHAKRDVLGEEAFETLTHLDLGDLVGVDGTVLHGSSRSCFSPGGVSSTSDNGKPM